MKKCNKCGEEKPRSEFHKHKLTKDKLQIYCKSCCSTRAKRYYKENAEHLKRRTRQWFLDNREYRREYDASRVQIRRANRYGLSVKELEALGSECSICSASENLVVDHCHITNRVRGILCSKCNKGLGSFNDAPELLARAINYLKGGK